MPHYFDRGDVWHCGFGCAPVGCRAVWALVPASHRSGFLRSGFPRCERERREQARSNDRTSPKAKERRENFLLSTFYLQFATCLIVSLVCLLIIPKIDWHTVLKIGGSDTEEHLGGIVAISAILSLAVILSIIVTRARWLLFTRCRSSPY